MTANRFLLCSITMLADQSLPKRLTFTRPAPQPALPANRQFSSYKRLSLDDPALEPVSPEHSTSFSNPSSMGGKTQLLARQKYLFGTFYVDTLLYNGSNYVYEIGVHMSDSSSFEVSLNFCTVF